MTAEDILQSHIARCADTITFRLANADKATSVDTQNYEMNAAVALLNASARLADALARLRGQTIHVTRSNQANRTPSPGEGRGDPLPDRGSNGR